MTWYAKGDPRWDADELWTTMGHLYKGGMWFKKKSVLQADGHYNSNTAADGTDWRTTIKSQYFFASGILPSFAEAGKYFYLPALGNYYYGWLSNIGEDGYYWSSSAYFSASYYLNIKEGQVYVDLAAYRHYGYPVKPTFE